MSYNNNRTDIGLLISSSSSTTATSSSGSNNREPHSIRQQQHHHHHHQQAQQQQQQPQGSNNNDNHHHNNNNNDGEKMVCENPGSPTMDKICENQSSSSSSSSIADLTNLALNGNDAIVVNHVTSHVTSGDKQNLVNLFHCDEETVPPKTAEDKGRKNLFRKYKLSIQNETVIVSRIDGILDSSGERSSLYKCHLCGKLGGTLEKLRRHLAAHSRKLPYRCRLCDVRFHLRPQLSFHTKTQHGSFWTASLETEEDGGEGLSNPHRGGDRVLNQVDAPGTINSSDGIVSTSKPLHERDNFDLSRGEKVDRVEMPRMKASVSESVFNSRNEVGISSAVNTQQGQNKYSFAKDFDHLLNLTNSKDGDHRQMLHSDHRKEFSNRCSSSFLGKSNKAFAENPISRVPVTTADTLGNSSESRNSQGMDMTCRLRPHSGYGHDQQGQINVKKCSDVPFDTARLASTESITVDLASKIRQTEHLGDDITVVIPSDAPIDDGEVKSGVVPRSGGESEAARQNRIMHAPYKSILGNSQLRAKRKLSISSNTPTSASIDSSLQKINHANIGGKSPTDEFSPHQMGSGSGSGVGGGSPGSSLPLSVYSPLALSSFVQGLNGLMSSSLLSPIITHTSFGFPGMLVNPLSLYAAQLSSNSITSLMNSKVANLSAAAAAATSMECNQRDLVPPPPSVTQPDTMNLDNLPDGGSRVKEELSNSNGSGCLSSTSDGYASPNSKCSSLSRTHSRLNVIQKPIKRENAYKPIIMSDGRTAYHCLYCNKNFCTISDVNRHMDFHEDIRPYKCRFCNYYARTNSQLKVHMMRHQGIRDFLCRLCNYKGVTQSDLNRHTKSQIHMMKERNVCTLCREGFVSPMNLEQHRIEKHLKMETCNDNGIKYRLTMAGLVKENASN